MRVLYLGAKDAGSTAKHRADALRRLGCEVVHHDPHEAIADAVRGRWAGALHYRTGYWFTHATVNAWVRRLFVPASRFDLCWVDSGEFLSAQAIQLIKERCARVVLFNHDDPTGPRDRVRFITLKRAVPFYDLCLAVRDVNVPEFEALGAKDVMQIWRSFDEVAHRPDHTNRPVNPIYQNDIVFLGRNMDGEGRDLLLHQLIIRGLRPAIWGDNWQASKVWPTLKEYWRGPGLSGQDYVDAIRGAAVCIGMLSKGNRDLHTTRTMEIPAAGGLLCAERTSEHQQLYREGVEAVFWSDAAECAEQCARLLAQPAEAQRIREAGHQRLLANQVGNEDVCRAVFARLGF